MASVLAPVYVFAGFRLEVLPRRLTGPDGMPLALGGKALEVLLYLIEHADRVVGKDELLARVWSGRVVEENTLTQAVHGLRKALGTGGGDHRYVLTVPGRGYRFVAELEEAGGVSPPAPVGAGPASGRRSSGSGQAWRSGAVFAAIVFFATSWWAIGGRDHGDGSAGAAVETAARPSVAVLPFIDLSPEQDLAWFSDGVAEDLLTLLARVPGLHVTARTSSFAFRGRELDIATIAARLDVDHILEGSVRRSQDRIRITAQLIEAKGGSHVWSETYDRAFGDVFAIQDEIAGNVAQALRAVLVGGGRNGETGDADAYEHFLHARFLFNRRLPGDLARAAHYYRQAIAVDPGFGAAWAGLAGALNVDILTGGLPVEQGMPEWEAALERALALAPDLPDTQHRAYMYFRATGDAERARAHLAKALAADLDTPLKLALAAGIAGEEGRLDDAIALQRRAVALDPIAPSYHHNLANLLFSAGRFDEAEAALRRAAELGAGTGTNVVLALLLNRTGRHAEAIAELEAWEGGAAREHAMVLAYRGLDRRDRADAALAQLMARSDQHAAVLVAAAFAEDGDFDAAFHWLQVARDRLDPDLHPVLRRLGLQGLHGLRHSELLRPLHGDPRWGQWRSLSVPGG